MCDSFSSAAGFPVPDRRLDCCHARFDILDLNRLGSVVEDGLCSSHLDGRRRVRVDHRLQQSGSCRRSSLLQPCDGLPESSPASLPGLYAERRYGDSDVTSVRRALQVAALPESWKEYFRGRLEKMNL
jgi:hypothetical protein